MVSDPVIAIDAMGGDSGPSVTVAAADIALRRHPHLRFRFYGDEGEIRAILDRFPQLQDKSLVVHSAEHVLDTDKPSQVLRRAHKSSMGMAICAVEEGVAHATVSAGNTGVLMAFATLRLGRIPGIHRPALATAIPTLESEAIMLDLGANSDCPSLNLVQFAIMGAAFARVALGTTCPRVALLNIGEEDLKGKPAIKDAAEFLRACDLNHPDGMDFVGFVEGNHICRGDVDVIVSDGFSGNVALKVAEGTARLVADILRREYRRNFWTRLSYLFSRGVLHNVRHSLDPDERNGAVFLGLNATVVKSHGAAGVRGFARAIELTHGLVTNAIPERITRDIADPAISAILDPERAA